MCVMSFMQLRGQIISDSVSDMCELNSSESGAYLKRGFYCLLAGLSDYDYKIPNEKTHLPFFIFNLSTLHTQTLHTESVYNSSCFKNSRYETK